MSPLQEQLACDPVNAARVGRLVWHYRRELSIDETEDVTQEGLLGLVEAAGRFREDRSLGLLLGLCAASGAQADRQGHPRHPSPARRIRTNVDERTFVQPAFPAQAGDLAARRPPGIAPPAAAVRGVGPARAIRARRKSVAHAAEISRDCGLSPRRVDEVMRAGLDRLLNIIASSYDRDVKTRKLFSATA